MLRYNTILLTRDVSGTVKSIWLVFDFQPETPVFKTELHFVYLSARRPSTRNSCLLARCGNTLQEKPRRPGLGSTPVGRPFRPTARGTASPEGTCSDPSGPSAGFPLMLHCALLRRVCHCQINRMKLKRFHFLLKCCGSTHKCQLSVWVQQSTLHQWEMNALCVVTESPTIF